MSATARTTPTPRGEEDRCHHTAFREWVDVDGVSPVDSRAMRTENSFHHGGVAGQPLRQWVVDVVGAQGCIPFDHADQPTETHPPPNIAAMTALESQPHALTDVRTLRHTLGVFRFGAIDPTARLDGTRLVMASVTPAGPGWVDASVTGVSFGGAGEFVIRERQPDPLGHRDQFVALAPAHDVVARLQRDFGGLRVGASADVYKAALTATLGQRITAAEAVNQWGRLCRSLSLAVETPVGTLLAPPDPATLSQMSPYQLHRFGIEEARARTLIAIARVFHRPGRHHVDPEVALRRLVADVPRFGPWTRALVEAEALGSPDAVAVGDFHLKNVVAHALTGRPRGTDEEMLAALSPYAGNRGRVLAWLALGGIAAPKFGPRRRNIDIRAL